MRDHGGNLDWAMARWGAARKDWTDLSTGINPRAYPVPELSEHAFASLPTRADLKRLSEAAASAYGTRAEVLPVAGAQAAIQMVPRLGVPGVARVLGPTYNEHAAAFRAAGWRVETVESFDALEGANAAVVVNPNNPGGRVVSREKLLTLARRVGLLIVDESFADPVPEVSVAAEAGERLLVLRSFGKFYGLAGLRLGFALGGATLVGRLAEMAGPWPVSGVAVEVGVTALADRAWQAETVARLARDAARMDALVLSAGWRIAGGTTLFRLYQVPDAVKAQERLAERRVWSRVFPYSDRWIRLGLPDGAGWTRLEAALAR